MNVKQVFELATKMGIAADPRGARGVTKYLARMNRQYQDLKPSDKKYFDQESLTNPYPDSTVHVDDGKTIVKRVLAGIDIGPGEILLASQMSERGKKIDLVISHHPEGKALANLHLVMEIIADVLEAQGVPVHLAEKIMEERIKEVGRGVHPINHNRAIDIAKALKINFASTHTITDNMVTDFLDKHLKRKKPETVRDLLNALMEIPEYQEAKKYGAGPSIVAGSPGHKVGRLILEMTGGTEPSSKIYSQLSNHGISTIVGMHMKEDSKDKASESQLNVVIAGHMSSDSLGMNLFLDALENKGIEVVPCGGLLRVNRNKKRGQKSSL